MFSQLFHTILYQPIFNLFVGLYNVLPGHDVGVVILIITILVRLLVYPLTNSSIKSQKAMQDLQPKIEAVKKEFANDKQRQSLELMKVYKENKVSPFASCLPLLIQLPILIALYMVMRDGLTAADKLTSELYGFVTNPGQLNAVSFGLINMAKANWILAVFAGAAQFWQAKDMIRQQPPKGSGAGAKDEGMAAMMNKQMLYFMPALTVFIGLSLPAGLTWYWLLSTLLTVAQQKLLLGKKKSDAPLDKGNVIDGQIVKK